MPGNIGNSVKEEMGKERENTDEDNRGSITSIRISTINMDMKEGEYSHDLRISELQLGEHKLVD